MRTIYLINKHINHGFIILANGCFIELAILRFFKNFDFIVKIPGDIVWERAKNNSVTTLDIVEFQKSRLPWRYQFFRKLFSYSLKHSSLVVVPSTQLASLALGWGADQGQIKLIHNSVEIPEVPESDSLPNFDFVTVSRLVPWKGMDQVIENVCGQGYTLLIIGDGPQREALELIGAKFPGLVEFKGEVAANRVHTEIKKAKYFILNSSFEATSYALLEAMSLGLVPIANEGTGSQEIIQHGVNGFLCGQISGMNLHDAISGVMNEDFKMQMMRKSAEETIKENFNLETNYNLIVECCIHACRQ